MLRVLTWRWRELADGGDVAAPGVSPREGRHDVAV
jgi:hypothetical protein